MGLKDKIFGKKKETGKKPKENVQVVDPVIQPGQQ